MLRAAMIAVVLTPLLLLDATGQDKKKAAPEPKVWMCVKGDLLWSDSFAGPGLPKEWRKGMGTWEVDAGVLSAAEVAADKHPAFATRNIADPNAIIQFSFKLDGAGWLEIGRAHV